MLAVPTSKGPVLQTVQRNDSINSSAGLHSSTAGPSFSESRKLAIVEFCPGKTKSGARSAKGRHTKSRPVTRGCGMRRPSSQTVADPIARMSRSIVRGRHRLAGFRSSDRSMDARNSSSSPGSRLASIAQTALRNLGWFTNPTGSVSYTGEAATGSVRSAIKSSAVTIFWNLSPRFEPNPTKTRLLGRNSLDRSRQETLQLLWRNRVCSSRTWIQFRFAWMATLARRAFNSR